MANAFIDWLKGGAVLNGATLLVAITALLVGAIAAAYARRALSPPKRQLRISVSSAAPSLPNAPEELTMHYRERVVSSPHVCSLRIESIGKHDIGSAQFDSKRPIRITLGVPIIGKPRVKTFPAELATPNVSATDGAISVGPSLISRGQRIEIVLLTDGAPTPSYQHNLLDTDVEFLNEEQERDVAKRSARAVQVSGISLVAAVVGLVITVVVAVFSSNSNPREYIDSALSDQSYVLVPASFSFYHPPGGRVPASTPTVISDATANQCAQWSSWADSYGAVPVGNSLRIQNEYSAGRDFSSVNPQVEVTSVRIVGTFPPEGNVELRCSTLVEASVRGSHRVDLNTGSIEGPQQLRAGQTAEVPASAIQIELRGTPGVGYEFIVSATIRLGTNSRKVQFGDESSPLRTVIPAESGHEIYRLDAVLDQWAQE